MKKYLLIVAVILVATLPQLALAQTGGSAYAFPSSGTLIDVIFWLILLINGIAIPGIIGLTFVVFLWGVFGYVRHGEDSDKRKEGRDFMIYAIVGMAVMLSFWGLVAVVVRTFGFSDSMIINTQKAPTQTGPQFKLEAKPVNSTPVKPAPIEA